MVDSVGEQRPNAERLALMQDYAINRNAAALGAQSTTLHVATGMVLLAGTFSLLVNFYQQPTAEQIDRWYWALLPVLPLFHLGWTTYRFALQKIEEQYLVFLETQLDGEHGSAFQFARVTQQVSAKHPVKFLPLIVAYIGAIGYLIIPIPIIVEAWKLGNTSGLKSWINLVAVLYGAVWFICALSIYYTTFNTAEYQPGATTTAATPTSSAASATS